MWVFDFFEVFLRDIELSLKYRCSCSEFMVVGRQNRVARFRLEERSDVIDNEKCQQNVVEVESSLLLLRLSLLVIIAKIVPKSISETTLLDCYVLN